MEEKYYIGFYYGSRSDRQTGEVESFVYLSVVSAFEGVSQGVTHSGLRAENLRCVDPTVVTAGCAALKPGDRISVAFNRYGRVCKIMPL